MHVSLRSRLIRWTLIVVIATGWTAAVNNGPAGAYNATCGHGQTNIGVDSQFLTSYYAARTSESKQNWNDEQNHVTLATAVAPLQEIGMENDDYTWSMRAQTIWACSGGQMSGPALIQLNKRLLKGAGLSDQYVRFVIVHELGHGLGLDHVTNPCTEAIMRAGACVGTSIANPPKSDDIAGVNFLY